MKWLEYIFLRILVFWFYITPYWGLYVLSDFFFVIIYHIIGYRKKVVTQNLRNSFPEKSNVEILDIQRKFYHHLCDVSIETIKGYTVSKKKLLKRYVVINPELAEQYFNKKQNLIFLASHYGNWEYGILAMQHYLKHQMISLYMPLTNAYIEKYGTKVRSRFGMKMVPVQQTKEAFSGLDNIPKGVIMAADQSPSNIEKSIWVSFLNQNTACLHGPEAYAKKTNMPLLYFKISKPKRGYYQVKIEVLIDNPSTANLGEITKKYMQKVEMDINEQPEFWLWSHRRWKHKMN
jgi:KDO2-lipid IV(A) lauroyltransferase